MSEYVLSAVYSKKIFDLNCDNLSDIFIDCISDIYLNETVQQLNEYTQHFKTSRLQHSVNVAYYSFLLAKALGLDYRSAARAGLLHDLYFYDWRETKDRPKNHAAYHPKVALSNAEKICSLNEVEKDAILTHMWPLTLRPPKHMVSYVVGFADKTCTLMEISNKMFEFKKLSTD